MMKKLFSLLFLVLSLSVNANHEPVTLNKYLTTNSLTVFAYYDSEQELFIFLQISKSQQLPLARILHKSN